MKEFWKGFNIYHAVKNIGETLNGVKQSNLNGAWRKLGPEFVSDFQGFTDTFEEVTKHVVEMSQEVRTSNVALQDAGELMYHILKKLIDEDFIDLEQQKVANKENELTVAETPPCKILTTKVLAEAFQHLEAEIFLFK